LETTQETLERVLDWIKQDMLLHQVAFFFPAAMVELQILELIGAKVLVNHRPPIDIDPQNVTDIQIQYLIDLAKSNPEEYLKIKNSLIVQ
jgi:hypothetical protein